MNISNTRVYGIEESILASGYPMLEKPLTVQEFGDGCKEIYEAAIAKDYTQKDLKRAFKLGSAKAGSGHDVAIDGIIVQFDLDAPIKMWTEIQRYNWISFISSQSSMHRIGKFELDNAYDEHVDERIIKIIQELQDKYNETKSPEDYHNLLMSNPTGMNLTARLTTNYRQLKTIYNQRKNHRLFIWHDFCRWCETLPLFIELTGVEPYGKTEEDSN